MKPSLAMCSMLAVVPTAFRQVSCTLLVKGECLYRSFLIFSASKPVCLKTEALISYFCPLPLHCLLHPHVLQQSQLRFSFFDVDILLCERVWSVGGDAVALPYLDDGTVDMGEFAGSAFKTCRFSNAARFCRHVLRFSR